MSEKKRKTCFVIGPIGGDGTETRKAADFLLKGIIRPATESFLNLKVWRADEDSQPGMITDKLINDLNDSDLVIADLSELNPNAFYELGIRHASAKPTIHMASEGTKLPFDNLGHRAIFFDKTDWQSIENAKSALIEQCEEAMSEGFQASNPVTQALSVKAFRASPKTEEKMLGDIMGRLEAIETQVTIANTASRSPVKTFDFSSRDRLHKLESAIRNISGAEQWKKYNIKDAQIASYASVNCDEDNYERIMTSLKQGNVAVVLTEVSHEIPF